MLPRGRAKDGGLGSQRGAGVCLFLGLDAGFACGGAGGAVLVLRLGIGFGCLRSPGWGRGDEGRQRTLRQGPTRRLLFRQPSGSRPPPSARRNTGTRRHPAGAETPDFGSLSNSEPSAAFARRPATRTTLPAPSWSEFRSPRAEGCRGSGIRDLCARAPGGCPGRQPPSRLDFLAMAGVVKWTVKRGPVKAAPSFDSPTDDPVVRNLA